MALDGHSEGTSRIPGDDLSAFDEWMARFADLDDVVVDQALRGEVPVGHEELAPIAELASTVRTRATVHAPEMGPALRTQIGARGRVPARHAGVVGRRLRLVVTASVAALVALVAAASQNALPAGAQRMVSDAAEIVGVSVPRPDDDPPQPPASEDSDSSTGSSAPTDATDPPDPADPAAGPSKGTESGGPDDSTTATSGPPAQTPGGATPADPGTPGDGEPATPATPPAHSNGGNGGGANAGGNGNGNTNGNNAGGNGNGQAKGLSTAPGQAQP